MGSRRQGHFDLILVKQTPFVAFVNWRLRLGKRDISRLYLVKLLVVYDEEFRDSLKHLVQILLAGGDVFHHADDLNDLLIAQEVEAGEVLSLCL